jgi:hypothetical protein
MLGHGFEGLDEVSGAAAHLFPFFPSSSNLPLPLYLILILDP